MVLDVYHGAVARLAAGSLSVLDVFSVADQLVAGGRADLAIQIYQLWVGLNPENPALYAACFNFGVLASAHGDLPAAKVAYERSIAAKPDFVQSYINLGGVLERQGADTEALSYWRTAIDRLSAVNGESARLKVLALRQLGRTRAGHNRPEAESALRQILELDPRESDIAEHYLALRLLQCNWPVVDPPAGMPRENLLRSLHPLSAAVYTDHPFFQLAQNWNYNRNRVGYKVSVLDALAKPDAEAGRLRIGYLSSDLCAHAVGYLIVEALERHDHQKVEVYVYYCGPESNDWINQRAKAVTDVWVDINALDDEAAARRIQADGIQILVDVNGNTKGSRTRICAMRPAPVIVNWLGFPGTMATPYHHYIIADDWIIPPEHELYVSEKVVRLPCYQPNDRHRQVSVTRPTRADAGLPDDATVYCCFNWTQKFSKQIFSMWMSILAQVPNSVLWLLETVEETNQHLQSLVVQHGIAAERIIYGKWMSSPDHLARYPLADLFLDTYPYGAHTTASDSLFMGVPILTLSGKSFASRVCGSLSRNAGVSDLVCETPDQYVRLAVELGHDRERINYYKAQLAAAKDSCALFDTDLLVRSLEQRYAEMWDDYCQGRLPQPDLTNLDVYLDVALEDDLEAFVLAELPDYNQWFRDKLARRHKVCPLPDDHRLWQSEKAPAKRRSGKAKNA